MTTTVSILLFSFGALLTYRGIARSMDSRFPVFQESRTKIKLLNRFTLIGLAILLIAILTAFGSLEQA